MNPFEAGVRKVIPAVLVYVVSADQKVLMIHRVDANGTTSSRDYHAGKWNGLGGKLELDESPLEGAIREVGEEAGLSLRPADLRVLGTLQFPNFKAHKNEDWLVFVLLAHLDLPASEIGARPGCPEGQLHWIPDADILKLSLWEGDRHFMPYVLEERPFFGTLWYQGQKVAKHWIMPLDSVSNRTHS